jgi:hypothetical protein
MAYNFLGLVNEVNRRFNEVELTSSNFATAKGFYSAAKDSVNTAIRDVNQSHYEWPFNHVLEEETLSAGTSRYSIPADASNVDYDSFRIKENTTFGNDTVKLEVLSYEDYLHRFVDQEYTSDTSVRGVPRYIVQAPSQEYIVVPSPDNAYEIVYEYYRISVDMQNSGDVPYIPERFKHVIVDGAMYHAYMFRGNEQSATLSKAKFEEGIKRMRTILINRYNYVTSTYLVQQSPIGIAGPRIK